MADYPPEKLLWRTFRVYFDVEVLDANPDDPDKEWMVIDDVMNSFYNMVDEGVEPEVAEIL